MKLIKTTALLLFISLASTAQNQYYPILNENAHWKIHIDNTETLWEDDIYEYVLRGDSTYNDITYKKVFKRNFYFDNENLVYPTPYQVTSESFYGLMREDTIERKVYAILSSENQQTECPSSQEYELFDFSKTAGDTLFNCSFVDQFSIIESIENSQIWSTPTRTFTTYNGALFEGIGSENGLFEPVFVELSGFYYTLIDYCIGSDSECNSVFTKSKNAEPFAMEIFPNPAKEELHIQLSENSFWEMIIHNVNGVRVLQKSFIGTQEKIDLGSFNNGLYFLLIKNANKQTTTQTFDVLK